MPPTHRRDDARRRDASHDDPDGDVALAEGSSPVETPDAGIVVPWERLSPEALRRVIEEFVTREGTEYGLCAIEAEAKVTAVRHQLERGTVVMLFDAATRSVNLATREELERQRATET